MYVYFIQIRFDKIFLKLPIISFLDQQYFSVENSFDIPLRLDPDSFMANLFLYYYENKWLLTKKSNLALLGNFVTFFVLSMIFLLLMITMSFRRNSRIFIHFPFYIVHMPYRESNLPCQVAYAFISSEILRLARTNPEKFLFVNTTNILLGRMYKQDCK